MGKNTIVKYLQTDNGKFYIGDEIRVEFFRPSLNKKRRGVYYIKGVILGLSGEEGLLVQEDSGEIIHIYVKHILKIAGKK